MSSNVRFTLGSTIFAACLFALGAPGFSAAAQDDGPTDLADCVDIEDAAERLECFDAVMARRQAEADKKRDPKANKAKEGEAKKPEPAARPAAPAAAPAVPARPAAQPAPVQPPAAEAEPKAPVDPVERFGLPREAPAQEPEEFVARVVNVGRTRSGKYYFELENGQIWAETDGSNLRVPRNVSEVRIRKGGFSGFRITIVGTKRNGWVKRIR